MPGNTQYSGTAFLGQAPSGKGYLRVTYTAVVSILRLPPVVERNLTGSTVIRLRPGGFKSCGDRSHELLWHIKVRNTTCTKAETAKRATARTHFSAVAPGQERYVSATGWSCRVQSYPGVAQDGEVMLWDCQQGSREVIMSDTASVTSRPL